LLQNYYSIVDLSANSIAVNYAIVAPSGVYLSLRSDSIAYVEPIDGLGFLALPGSAHEVEPNHNSDAGF
jgi:hypothetical protein